MTAILQNAKSLIPGIVISVTVALAVGFISEHYGGPQFLLALLLGMAFNFAAKHEKVKPGIDFASRTVLRLGVMLLGIRITFRQVIELGPLPVFLAVTGVVVALSAGMFGAKLLRRSPEEGVLSGGAVGICGASAAMAISAALPRGPRSEQMTLLTVVGVTALSTVAMIIYPILSKLFGFGEIEAGVFFGSTIHDVAQVLGAGMTVSSKAGDVATLVKLVRVACLLPVVLFVAWMFRAQTAAAENVAKPPLLPSFLVGFAVLVVIGSFIDIPAVVVTHVSDVSRACLIVAISALGVKTSFGDLLALGWSPLLLVIAETLVLLVYILALLLFFGIG